MDELPMAGRRPANLDSPRTGPPAPPDLPRRLLELVRTGAIWVSPSSWSLDENAHGARDERRRINPHDPETATSVAALLERWSANHLIGFTTAAQPGRTERRLVLLGPGHAELDDLLNRHHHRPEARR